MLGYLSPSVGRPGTSLLTPTFASRQRLQSQPRVVTETHEQGPLIYFDSLL